VSYAYVMIVFVCECLCSIIFSLGLKPKLEAQDPKNLSPNPYNLKTDTHMVSASIEIQNPNLVQAYSGNRLRYPKYQLEPELAHNLYISY
jgi:hypothetical protein